MRESCVKRIIPRADLATGVAVVPSQCEAEVSGAIHAHHHMWNWHEYRSSLAEGHPQLLTCLRTHSAQRARWTWFHDSVLSSSKIRDFPWNHVTKRIWSFLLPHCTVRRMCRVRPHGPLWLDSVCGTSPPSLLLNWSVTQTTSSLALLWA